MPDNQDLTQDIKELSKLRRALRDAKHPSFTTVSLTDPVADLDQRIDALEKRVATMKAHPNRYPKLAHTERRLAKLKLIRSGPPKVAPDELTVSFTSPTSR